MAVHIHVVVVAVVAAAAAVSGREVAAAVVGPPEAVGVEDYGALDYQQSRERRGEGRAALA